MLKYEFDLSLILIHLYPSIYIKKQQRFFLQYKILNNIQPALQFINRKVDMHQDLPQRIGNILYDASQLKKLKILIVGVGGIGCQLLKVLCKMPIGQIHIIDMDTIQISNLNRQFLFKTEHKGQSKALVAKQSIKKINPYLNIEAHHKNIKQLSITFFKRFNYLIMALDNIQTRNYVNKIGVRLNIPTIDAGTLGFKGNVHVIIPHKTRCYSCQPKVSSQKSFPVCTIRMRPQKPIHCIVWAKMLFQVLFSGQEVNNDMKDLANLAETGDQNSLLKQLLHTEILNIKVAKTDSDSLLTQDYLLKIKPLQVELLLQKPQINLDAFDSFDSSNLSTNILVSLAKLSFLKLKQQKQNQGSVIFQKDDDVIIYFISAFANLRMLCFSIQQQSFNEVKNMAGNIVPAIASTNSIVSGLEVIEMIKLLSRNYQQQSLLRSYYIQNQSYKVRALKVQLPIPQCLVCSTKAMPVIVQTNMKQTTFSIIIQLLKNQLQQLDIQIQFSINKGQKQLYNSQQPNKKILDKKLLQLSDGVFEMDLKIINQDQSQVICTLWVIHNDQIQHHVYKNIEQIHKNLQKNIKNKKQQLNQIIQQRQQQQQANNNGDIDSDSDCIMQVGANGQNKDQSSDEIEIIQVKKVDKNNHNIQGKNDDISQVNDKVQKKIKQR